MMRRVLTAGLSGVACVALLGSKSGIVGGGRALSMVSASASGLSDSIPLPKKFINASVAQAIDVKLMEKPGWTIDQLMELAGLSVAQAVYDFMKNGNGKRVLLVCGPGNNGGDGLVAARHLHHFGYKPTILYPKAGKGELFTNLIQQVKDLNIPVITDASECTAVAQSDSFDLVVDGMFGFSFKGEAREPFKTFILGLAASTSSTPVLSIDIPSGWHVEKGDLNNSGFKPDGVISLTVPKLCMQGYEGVHYVGGRFVPPNVAAMFDLDLPTYAGTSQIARYSTGSESEEKEESVTDTDTGVSVVYITASGAEEAKLIAEGLVKAKLCACVNIIPIITSVYEWEGKIENSSEAMLVVKTQTRLVSELTKKAKDLHSYDVPEVIAMNVIAGSKDYLDWVKESTNKKQEVQVGKEE